ncbi:hypothetical protein P8452_72952 [Trifolium repens]|nr:hypothetical protein P8452_72952 [Trifolium repens]
MLKFLSKLLKKPKSKEPIAKRAEVGKGKKVKDPNMLNRPPTAFVVLIRRKILRSNQCTAEGVRSGFKGAEIGCVASTVPILGAVQMIPWAKVNLNYTAQALIISSGHCTKVSHNVNMEKLQHLHLFLEVLHVV